MHGHEQQRNQSRFFKECSLVFGSEDVHNSKDGDKSEGLVPCSRERGLSPLGKEGKWAGKHSRSCCSRAKRVNGQL